MPCVHGRQASRCVRCGGVGICAHGTRRETCAQCGGRSICEHGTRRRRCRACRGSSICAHDKERSNCSVCTRVEHMLATSRFCQGCCSKRLSTPRLRAGVRVCAECDAGAVDRIEVVVRPLLLSAVSHPPSAVDDTLFGQTCDVVRRRRPDLAWLGADRVVVCEIDERGGHGAGNYTPECDLGWVMDLNEAVVQLYRSVGSGRTVPLVVVRFNPDECDRERATLEERVRRVAGRLEHFLTVPAAELDARRPRVEYHYYHSKCEAHIRHAEAHPDAVLAARG